jgi:hypothetical protein
VAGLLIGAAPAFARELEPAACEKAKADHALLVAAGVRNDMAKGPEWAASNLSPERIARIKTFLSLEEDIRFRCPLALPRPPKPEKTATTTKAAPEATPEAKPLKPSPKAKPQRQRKAVLTQTQPLEPAEKKKARPPSALQDQAKELEKKPNSDGEGDQ